MPKRRQKIVEKVYVNSKANWKKWAWIPSSVLAIIGIFTFGQSYVKDLARDVVNEELKQYPPPVDFQEMKADLSAMKTDMNTVKETMSNINGFLEGAKIRR